MKTTYPLTTKNGSDIPVAMLITLLDFVEILLETFLSAICLNVRRVCSRLNPY